MNSLTRWNPFQEMMTLTNQFDRLFEDAFAVSRPQSRIWNLDLDVRETDDAYLVKVSVPGFAPDQINVTLDQNVLTIKGDLQEDELQNNEIYHLRERRFGRFSRSISLPDDVVAEEIQATVEQGVLSVHIPKHEASKPKQIPVRSGQKLMGSGSEVIEGETA